MTADKGRLRVYPDIDLMRVCRAFEQNGIRLTRHQRNQIDLESYFMELVGGGRA